MEDNIKNEKIIQDYIDHQEEQYNLMTKMYSYKSKIMSDHINALNWSVTILIGMFVFFNNSILDLKSSSLDIIYNYISAIVILFCIGVNYRYKRKQQRYEQISSSLLEYTFVSVNLRKCKLKLDRVIDFGGYKNLVDTYSKYIVENEWVNNEINKADGDSIDDLIKEIKFIHKLNNIAFGVYFSLIIIYFLVR